MVCAGNRDKYSTLGVTDGSCRDREERSGVGEVELSRFSGDLLHKSARSRIQLVLLADVSAVAPVAPAHNCVTERHSRQARESFMKNAL